DSAHTLSVGIQVGLNYRKVNMDKFYFDNQFNGLIFDASLGTNEVFQNDSRANLTSAAGIVHSYYYGKHNSLRTGISGHNLNRPNQGFYGSKVLRDIRISIYSQLDHAINRE